MAKHYRNLNDFIEDVNKPMADPRPSAAPKPNTTNSGTVASEAVVEITMESLEASNHPEAKAILALIASKVEEATDGVWDWLLPHISNGDIVPENKSWAQLRAEFYALQPREQDKV